MAREAEELAAQAERIKALRKAKRVSQETAAHEIGVSVRGYREWESGNGGLSHENLKAAAAYFDTTPDYIEYGEPEPKGATPDLMGELGSRDQLDRIEKMLQDLIEQLVVARVIQGVEPSTETKPSSGRAKRPNRAA